MDGLILKGVSKSFGNTRAVEPTDLRFAKGELGLRLTGFESEELDSLATTMNQMAEQLSLRIRTVNDGDVNSNGDYVLYWMTANRRTQWNFSLQRAIDRQGGPHPEVVDHRRGDFNRAGPAVAVRRFLGIDGHQVHTHG